MSKVEMIAHLVMAFVMLVLCHGNHGWFLKQAWCSQAHSSVRLHGLYLAK